MNVLAVLENEAALPPMTEMIREMKPEANLMCFGSSLLALAAAREQEIDVALIDTALPELSGINFGRYLQELYPRVNLIYLASDREPGFDALRQHASGILPKPVEETQLRRELDELRFPDGLSAILINNRGAQTTNGEIIASLWEDDGDPEKKGSYLSNLRQDLQNTFTRLKLNGVILKQRGSLAIAADRIECDLYDWLEKKQSSRYQYLGDYMNQYSWPEVMHAQLDEIAWSFEEE